MRSPSRFVFLVNAAAGTGKAPRRLDALLARHPSLAARSRIVRSSSVAELDAALRLHDDEIPAAVGGDGSLNALVTLLHQRGELQRTVAIVPFGTGNATAHTLGLRSADIAMAALERGATSSIDIMRTSMAQAPIALVSCSTGFESRFLQRYASLRYGSRQWAAWSALALNLRTTFRGVSLTIDGVEWVHPTTPVHNVGLYNIPHYAFGKVMWRGMRADDGLAIAAEIRSSLPYWNLMARGVAAPAGPHTAEQRLPGVRTIRWHTAELRSPLRLQVDGESIDATEASLRVDPRALTAICA
ncbi:MAG: diacylglycerol kinase family protein [Gemmatimonadaceae bacterium]|nr:diacylglycerol kinase family protein [Gemmatimonadaceae bacterium]